jgi:hypothetical protein
LLRDLNAAGRSSALALTPDQHLLALAQTPLPAQTLGPHFSTIDAESGKLRLDE